MTNIRPMTVTIEALVETETKHETTGLEDQRRLIQDHINRIANPFREDSGMLNAKVVRIKWDDEPDTQP